MAEDPFASTAPALSLGPAEVSVGGDPFAQTPVTPSAFDWIKGFTMSAVESIPELVGITPSTETQHFRQDNPVSGVVSELAGMAVPYMGWFKAAKAIPRFEAAVAKIGDISSKPFVTGALQESARLLPFEAGRLGVSQVVGDKSFGQMLGETTLNLGLGAGLGGLLHGLAAAGKRDPALRTLFPDLDIAAPLPLMARQMKEIVDSGRLQGDALGRATAKLNETLRKARTEELTSSFKYIAPIAHDVVPGAKAADLEHQLNRLFRVREKPDESVLQVRKFAHGVEKDFPSNAAWQAEARAAGLPEGFEAEGQFFRTVSFKKDAPKAADQALTIDSKLTKNMLPVGGGTFMAREADDGLFVMAKKYSGSPGSGTPEDKWVLFKTDKPGLFAPDADAWAKLQVAQQKWIPQADLAADGGDIYNAVKNWTVQYPLRNYRALQQAPGGVAGLIAKAIPQNVRGPQNEVFHRVGEVVSEYLTPRIFQFKKSPRANWIVNTTKLAYDRAETLTQELMNGVIKLDPGKSLFWNALGRNEQSPLIGQPVRKMVEALPEAELESFWRNVWRPGRSAAELDELVLKGEVSPEVREFAKNLESVDNFMIGNISKTQEAVGERVTDWKKGHFGLSRVWEGDTRIFIQNDTGQIVAAASGVNRRAAKANAEALLKENPGWSVAHESSISEFAAKEVSAIPESLRPVIKAPSWLLERQDLRGFKWDTKPFTKAEFLEAYEASLRSRNNYQANLTVGDMLNPQLDTLVREDPSAFRAVKARMNDYAGVQGDFGRIQNKIADQILGPILGPQSASKIVGATNTALFNLQLGALRLSYPVVNALQFVQTVIPEAAFILNGLDDRLAGKYSFFAAGGTKGPVGAVGVLSPLKLMYSSLKEMRAPSKELTAAFEQAVNDRVIDPRIVENYVGESATKLRDLGKVLKGEESVLGWIRALSEFLPAESERFARGHAFTVGYGIARDFLKREGQALDPDQLYQFARQFTENTMFLYSTADKPRVFTTPAGSMMGLFKNWMFHYMASMGEYAAEGFARNNWSPLLWQTAGTAVLGGVSATPLVFAADGFSRMWNNKSLMQNAYDQFGAGADGVMLGLPAAMTGVSLFSQVSAPGANPVRDASSLFSIVAWDRMKAIGKASGAAMDHWQATGQHPGNDRSVRELMARAFAPTTVYRMMQAVTPDQITSLGTGYPLVKEVPTHHRVLFGLGFNPVELDRGLAVSNDIYSKQEKTRAQVVKLGEAWADAQRNKDSSSMAIIMRQAMVWGVDVGSVLRSGLARLSKDQQDVVERRIRPQDISAYLSILQAGRE